MMSFENYDPYFPDQPVVDQYLPIWANLPAFKNKPAFIWDEDGVEKGSNLTYWNLNYSAQSISERLLIPLQRGDTVVILCSPGLELVELIFGCQRAGLLAIPIMPPDLAFLGNSHHHFLRILSQAKPRAAIASSSYIKHVQNYVCSSRSGQLFEMLQKPKWLATEDIMNRKVEMGSNFVSYNGCRPDEIYLIQYTSGATGIPKPVLVSAGSAAHNVRAARKAYDLHPNSVIVSWLPQYHDCGLMFLLLTIAAGATCILTSAAAFITRPRLWLELITKYKASCTPVPSFTLPLVVKRGGVSEGDVAVNLWSLNNLILINEPIYKAAVDEFVEVFRTFGLNPSSISPSYGLAESCTFVSTAWRGSRNNGSFPSHNKLLPSARLGSDHNGNDEEEIKILVVNEETHEPVEDGSEGEIWVSSPSNASGYLGHPSLTREIFQARLRNRLSQCFIRTGDRGIVKGEERYLFVTGRSSDTIPVQNGQEAHPHYIETAAYGSCPQFLRPGCLAAFMVNPSGKVALVAELQRRVGETEVLRRICVGIKEAVKKEEIVKVDVGLVVLVKCASVPKTTSGKIQRWLAKDKLLEGKMDVVMQMHFDDDHANGGMTVDSFEGRRKVEDEQRGRVFLSSTKAAAHPSLLSSL
ncbi:uncharacterized protein LOC127808424 [Diospyros lotus]|uniref:uncharacterized protein LOC127808424 n=1 Tax=Diospyros lotus TaxID=55363 RepID=UPI00225AC745|nr:uncharacterized protein LOC127808424 [Diospyros lotus]